MANTYKNFIVEIKDNIAIYTINREKQRNALNAESWEEIIQIIDEIDNDDSIRVAIFTGKGDKAFISGADINMVKERTLTSSLEGTAQKALMALENSKKATISAINGYCFGGGFELALATDIRVASENALFGFPEVGLGIMPGGGGTQRLSKNVGLGRAKDLILTGRTIKADDALSYGLVTDLVKSDELMDHAIGIAKKICEKGPVSIMLAKKAINQSLSTDQNAGMLLELLSYSILVGTEDKTEGVNAFFEKRTPNFKGE